jgi:two-component system, LuxR family, sensor histidine kinase DctS
MTDRPDAGRSEGKAPSGEEPRPVVRAADRTLSAEDLAYLNRMTTVGQVLPNLAHEMNNAFQVIGGLIEMLTARSDLAPDVADKVKRIGAQSSRAAEMMRELVAFARRDYGGTRLVDLAKVVERALAMRRYQLARARVSVSLRDIEPGRWITRADGHHLEQALANVLINAEQSVAGRERPEITVAITAAEGALTIVVADNGPGLDAGIAERAAAPFFTTRESAAGLGLTVATLLAEAEGGRLHLESAPGGGTRVALRLPRKA